MVIDVLRNDELETQEKMMLLLFYLGMADRYQLAKLLARSVHTVDQTIKRLNKKSKEEKHIQSCTAPFNKGPRMYQLGPAGWKWVMGWLEEDRRYYERSESQKRHYRGMTEILIRLMHAMGRDEALDRLRFYNTYEATEMFRYPWEVVKWQEWQDMKLRQEEDKELPRPDLCLEIDDVSFWIEYDTANESPTKIKAKYRRYYRAYNQLATRSSSRKPVVWVTTSRSRVELMKSWLEVVRREWEFREMKNPPPEMRFFKEGEETSYFLESLTVRT
ncbi:replication-relaxation family protein [Laceyella tengchongensis]|uniref:replication-relaxation family protein n=1 Tax=Laceyella tengchongensis TaxID=574699 RepID=UPI0012B6BA27|nr:hypothetical protein [Laceyella tengchongensis]